MDCIAQQAPLSVGFSSQEYWSGLPLPFPGDLPDPGIKPKSPAFPADSLPSEPPGKPINIGTCLRKKNELEGTVMVFRAGSTFPNVLLLLCCFPVFLTCQPSTHH